MGTLNISFDLKPKDSKTIKKEYKALMKKYSFYVVKFKKNQGVFYDLKKNKHKSGELVYTLYKDVIPAKQGNIDVSITGEDEKPGLIVRQIKNYKELIEINIGKCSSTPMVVTTPKADEQYLIAECKYTELDKPNCFCLVDDIDDPKIGDILYVTIDKRTSTKVNSREQVYTDYDAEVQIVDIKFYTLMNLPCSQSSLKRARTTLNKVIVKDKGLGLKVRTEDGFCCKAKCYLPNPEIGMKCILSGANDYVGNIEEFIQIDPNDSSLREIKEPL